MSNWIWFFTLANIGATGGLGWYLGRKINGWMTMTRKAIDARFDCIYAELSRHEQTFARSRRGRPANKLSEKEAHAPKAAGTNGVSSFVSNEAS